MIYPTKICEHCKSEFTYRKTVSLERWLKQKNCSTKCGYDSRRKFFESKYCLHCNKQFGHDGSVSSTKWGKRKYCTVECRLKATDTSHMEQYRFKEGEQRSVSGQFKIGQMTNEKNPKWKGENASYAAIHIWMRNHFGAPKLCEHCGDTTRKMYHWANLSGTYKRERFDWIRLCVPCHKRRDYVKKGI